MDPSSKELEERLRNLTSDPLIALLLSESNLTEKQLQAILIDLFATKEDQKRLRYEEKAQIMPKRIKRGAYNRILAQGRRNIIRAFFTIYLIGYLEIIDMEAFEGHINLGVRIREYIEAYRRNLPEGFSRDESERLKMVYRELLERVKSLIKPISLKVARDVKL